MNELEKLFHTKSALLNFMHDTDDAIIALQIVKPGYLDHLGFKLSEVQGQTLYIYDKHYSGGVIALYLDLKNPNIISFQKNRKGLVYSFNVETVEEFKALLIFLNVINE